MSIAKFLIFTILFISNEAYAKNYASFDCSKANSATEKTICTNDTLGILDLRMAKIWKYLLSTFDEDKFNAMLRQDQRAWLVLRDQCQNDKNCIAKAYRQRLLQLGYEKDSRQLAGHYVKDGIGGVVIYPSNSRDYLVHIQAADPKRGAWTCMVVGTGKADGKKLSIAVDEDSDNLGLIATLSTPNTLTIEPDDATSKVSRSYCGAGGTIAFTYHREK